MLHVNHTRTNTYIHTNIHTYIHKYYVCKYVHTCVRTYIHKYLMHPKMSEIVCEVIENAVILIVFTADRIVNVKKELNQTIFDNVSTLRVLSIQIKPCRVSKTKTISGLVGVSPQWKQSYSLPKTQ